MKFTCNKYPKLHIGLHIAFDDGVYETDNPDEIASIKAFSAKYGIEADMDSLFTGLTTPVDPEPETAEAEPKKEEEKEEKPEEAGDDGQSTGYTREDLDAMSVKTIKNLAATRQILLEGTKKDELIDSFLEKQGE
jgi:hypothetical protein